jgi:hypothetical protein
MVGPEPRELILLRDPAGNSPPRPLTAIAVLSCILVASCVAIGPTVQVSPGPDKSQAAFDADRAFCGHFTDGQLQPVANALNGAALTADQVTANNRRIQADYNGTYGECMASRGDIVPAPAQGTVLAEVPPPAPAEVPAPVLVSGYLHAAQWRFLRLAYHRARQAQDADDALWRREIADPPAGPGSALPVYSVSLADGARTLLVSIAGQGPEICDNGPNTAGSTRDYAVCPGKLAILRDGRVASTQSAGPLCAETINDGVSQDAPDWKDPARWGTRARYDRTAGTIELVTMQDGRVERACSKVLHVQ